MDNLKSANFHLYTTNGKKYILDYMNIYYTEITDEQYRDFQSIESKGFLGYIKNDRDESHNHNKKIISQLYEKEIFSQHVLLILHRITMKRLLVWHRFMHVICNVGIVLHNKVIIISVKKKQ